MTKENRDEKIKRLKAQINNINIVGKILAEEASIIKGYLETNKIIGNEDQQAQIKDLRNIVVALGVSVQYFEGKITGMEKVLKAEEEAAKSEE